MKQLKVGVVASGFTGVQHIEALRRIPGIEVAALVDTDEKSLKEKAEKLNVPNIFYDYREMIDQKLVDVVHNCTPNALHYEINKYAIEKGIHVYCEKPLGILISEARQLVQAAKEHDVAAGVNFNYRHYPMVQEMKSRIKSKEAGDCFFVHGHYLQDWLMKQTDYNWRLDSKTGGASRATADIGSHWFDTIQCILNKKIISVYADLFIAHPTRKKPKKETETFVKANTSEYEEVKVTSEDGGMIMLRFEDGTRGNLIVSQVSGGHKNDLEVSVSSSEYFMKWNQEKPDDLQIGTRDNGNTTIAASADTIHEEVRRYATLPAGHVSGWSDALRNGIKEFYQSIQMDTYRNSKQTYATFEDAEYIMRIVEACMKSSKSQTWVEV